MSDRSAKLRKLNGFRRRLPHCTASALAAILADVRENGIPEGNTSRNALRDARDLQNSELTPSGAVIQTRTVYDKHDGEQQLTLANPLAILWKACSDCNSFNGFFEQKLESALHL
jgi:hypothetical protein